MQADGEPSVALLLHELIAPAVPDLDGPRTVLPGGNLTLELRVVQRVILDVHGEMAASRRERQPFRHRPAEQHPVPLEPEVVVEAASLMPLNDEAREPARRTSSERLGRRLRIALAPVLARRHGWPPGSRGGEEPFKELSSPGKDACIPGVFGQGISLWKVWRAVRRVPRGRARFGPIEAFSSAREDAHRAELLPSAAPESRRGDAVEIVEMREDRGPQQRCRGIRVGVRTTDRLGHDPIDHAELQAMCGIRLERGGRLLRLSGIAPEDRARTPPER